jgi:xanthine dehydrogenase small subunit
VVTVEGLSSGHPLTPIQQAMVDCHGSQCGFCTPGFVMAMTAMCDHAAEPPADDAWRQALTGNLCRCTGYVPILEAGRRAAQQEMPPIDETYPPPALLAKLGPLADDTLDLRGSWLGVDRQAFCPTSLAEATAFRAAHLNAKIVAGATDVGVQWNKRSIGPSVLLDLNRVAELEGVQIEQQGGVRTLVAGARATWTELYEVCRAAAPQLAEIISIFGSPQIRHVGTIGGRFALR